VRYGNIDCFVQTLRAGIEPNPEEAEAEFEIRAEGWKKQAED